MVVLERMNGIMILGSRVVVRSFVEGDRIVPMMPTRRETDDDILARALWLMKHVSKEAGEEYLEKMILERYSAKGASH